jgi:molybdopterin biosynthesis enzyme MoaB
MGTVFRMAAEAAEAASPRRAVAGNRVLSFIILRPGNPGAVFFKWIVD